jgi:HAD superfamily hydrolase (TIGR01549 family)
MTIKAVIFDIGGVLVRTGDRLPRLRLAERLGMTYAELSALVFDSPSAVQVSFGQISVQQHWEIVCQALHLPTAGWQALEDEFFVGDRVDMELVNYVRSLHPRYRTGIISNGWPNVHPSLTEKWKIGDAFDEIIISAEVGLAKPDPRIFALAISRLNIAPAEAVFVDDFPENVEAARNFGLYAIRFQDPAQAIAEVNQLLEQADGTD